MNCRTERTNLVNLGQLMNLVDVVTLLVHSVRDNEETHISGLLEHTVHLLVGLALDIRLEAAPPRIDLTDSLLQGFLERATDSHDLTDTLHRRTNFAPDVRELRKVPLRDLGDDVVEGRFEAGSGGLRDSVRERRKSVTKGNLRSGVCKRVAGGLGR